jgi:hypothetical protein
MTDRTAEIFITTEELLDAAPYLADAESVADGFIAGARAAAAVLAPKLLEHKLSIYVYETEED